jgi:hypothetical protein
MLDWIENLSDRLIERVLSISRSPIGLAAIGVSATLVLALLVVIALLLTGGADSVSENAALIGALIALGGVFTTQLVNTGLEAQRAREAALQKYLEQVGKLLIEHWENDHLGTVTRAQTLAVLEGLDPERKRILLQFLYESDLIDADKPVISLWGANLNRANLFFASLERASLERANLVGANLFFANLERANLEGANLEGANLGFAENLTQEQIDQAFGDENTTLPGHLQGIYKRRPE